MEYQAVSGPTKQ